MGTAWAQDAFSQAELALQALKLATEFLIEGGTFVTKVFRSKDYNALLWVFQQLFAKVEATKPPSSRNVSAEIFVVCRGFKSPKRIDPKFLDPRSVFEELQDPTPNNEAKVFNPEKKKRKRDGYEEGDYTQFKEISAYEFIENADPIALLGSFNRLLLEPQSTEDVALTALNSMSETTEEIRKCCADLKVLGRKEFRILLKWRLKVRERFGLVSKTNVVSKKQEEVVEIAPMEEELQIQKDLESLNEKEVSRKKRERRRNNERKQKDFVRMQLHMMAPTDIGLEQAGPYGEDSIFTLAALNTINAAEQVTRGEMSLSGGMRGSSDNESTMDEESDEDEDQLDQELDILYSQYQERKASSDAKHRAKKARKEGSDDDWEGFSDPERSSEECYVNDSSAHTSEDEDPSFLLRQMGKQVKRLPNDQTTLTRRASNFFHKDVFRDIGNLEADEGNDSAVYMNTSDSDLTSPNLPAQTITESMKQQPEILVLKKNSPLLDTKLSKTSGLPNDEHHLNRQVLGNGMTASKQKHPRDQTSESTIDAERGSQLNSEKNSVNREPGKLYFSKYFMACFINFARHRYHYSGSHVISTANCNQTKINSQRH